MYTYIDIYIYIYIHIHIYIYIVRIPDEGLIPEAYGSDLRARPGFNAGHSAMALLDQASL